MSALNEVWRKSSRSNMNGSCVEARYLTWRKRSRSNLNGSCVEVRDLGGTVEVRDSKLGQASPILRFPGKAWTAFTGEMETRTADA